MAGVNFRIGRERGWRPSYWLPASGAAVAINTNTAQTVKIAAYSDDEWLYSNFQQYGGGTYVEDYSDGGAYVIAGCGGHSGPGHFGALIFDFADAAWKTLNNANGVTEAPNASGIAPGAVNAEGEISAATSGQLPAPFHPYALMHPLSIANGGGTKGSVICAFRPATTTSATAYYRSMQFDLDTGLWERFSTNGVDVSDGTFADNCSSAYDPTENCVWALPSQIHAAQNISKLPLSSPTWSSQGGYGWPSDQGQNRNCFVYDSARLLVAGTNSGGLRALNLSSIASGWSDLTVSGTLPDHDFTWAQYSDGNWYTRGTTGSVYKLVPPATNPLSNTWTVSTITLTGATLANAPDRGNGALHNTRLFYVPTIDCLAWVPGDTQDVVIFKP